MSGFCFFVQFNPLLDVLRRQNGCQTHDASYGFPLLTNVSSNRCIYFSCAFRYTADQEGMEIMHLLIAANIIGYLYTLLKMVVWIFTTLVFEGGCVVSKYKPLADYLSTSDQHDVRLCFAEIEDILGFMLPYSATRYAA